MPLAASSHRLLRLDRVRSVVGRDDIDRAVGESLAQGGDVLVPAQGRVDLEAGIVAAGKMLGEQEMMRGDLGRDLHTPRLRPADDLDAAGGRDMAHVQAGADVLGEQHVARDDRLLGHRRPSREPEFAGDRALVHLRADREPGLLRMLRDDAAEGLHVLERAAHEQRVVHAVPVVGEHPHPRSGLGHRADLGEALTRKASGHGTDRTHRHVAGRVPERLHLLDDARAVLHGHRVGHREDRREAAGRRGARCREHRLALLEPGFAQVGVQVDETGEREQPVGVDRAVIERAEILDEDAVGDVEVGARAVREGGARDSHPHAVSSLGVAGTRCDPPRSSAPLSR